MSALPATELKEKGNVEFKIGNFEGAIACYTVAILADPTDAAFPLNRAAAYLKVNKNEEAENDCSTVLKLQERNVKALYRRAQARIALKKLSESRQDLEDALKIEPGNATIRAELANVQVLIADEADTTNLPEMLQNRVIRLKKRLRDFQATQKFPPRNPHKDYPYGYGDEGDELKASREVFLKILRDTCALVREGEAWKSPDLPALVESVHKVLIEGIRLANGVSQMFEYLPSWAHDAENESPLVEDPDEKDGTIPRTILFDVLNGLFEGKMPAKATSTQATAWKPSMKRTPKSSPLARFRRNPPGLTPVPFNAVATSVYEARCEVSAHKISTPIKLRISQESNVVALNAMGGWKNYSPALWYFLLDEQDIPVEERPVFPESRFVEPGLTAVANEMAVDEGRRLIFVGDDKRIKSYSWADPSKKFYAAHPIPTHTFDSTNITGPMLALPNGNIIRASKGGAALWHVPSMPTHGPNGTKLIGKKISVRDTLRDDPEEIEPSSGSPPTFRLGFADEPNLMPGVWHLLPKTPLTILSSTGGKDVPNYGCITIDFEGGGKTSARYIGHGGTINEFSTSAADPNVFMTACKDGYARLFDVRRPLPVCTFNVGVANEACEGIALAHPDGIPTLFTGSTKGEHIKMWDVRACATVYELATGNNQVASLAWDATRNTLFAATECLYRDRQGYRHSYRPAKMPIRTGAGGVDEKSGFYWPDRAPHKEDYYEYSFDAGEHRIYQYAFKQDPNLSIVPVYGEARVGEEYTFR